MKYYLDTLFVFKCLQRNHEQNNTTEGTQNWANAAPMICSIYVYRSVPCTTKHILIILILHNESKIFLS